VVRKAGVAVCDFWTGKWDNNISINIVIFWKILHEQTMVNPCGENNQLIVHLNVAKMAERSEASR